MLSHDVSGSVTGTSTVKLVCVQQNVLNLTCPHLVWQPACASHSHVHWVGQGSGIVPISGAGAGGTLRVQG